MDLHSLYRRELYKLNQTNNGGEYLSVIEDMEGNPLSSVTFACVGTPLTSYANDSMAFAVFY